MAYIHSAHTAFPENHYSQDEIKSVVTGIWPDKEELLCKFFESTGVKKRHLALPLQFYKNLGNFGQRNMTWKNEAVPLQMKNIHKVLDVTKINSSDIKSIASVNTTGLCVPSLEALLMNKMAISPNTKRMPFFGLGCLGGVAGINRMNDYLAGHPKEAGLVLVTELCSLTFQFHDSSIPNLVGSALFGDGAGAVLLVGKDHALAEESFVEILNSKSIFYPDTERLMGWDMVDTGFQIVLSSEIPNLVKSHVGKDIEEFIRQSGFEKSEIDFYFAHPGGPKVLQALVEALNISPADIKRSWDSLAERGNVSSVSVIDVLEKAMQEESIKKGSVGVMLAMGPAFSLELSLVKKC